MGTAPLTTVGALLLGARSNVGPRSSHRTMKPLPETHDPVLVERFVDAHDGEAAFECLGSEQAIKRIAMVKRQRCDPRDVPNLNSEQLDSGVRQKGR